MKSLLFKSAKFCFIQVARALVFIAKILRSKRRGGGHPVKLSIVVLTWNRKEMLSVMLPALLQNLSPDISKEIIIWNNGSTDGTREYLDENFPSSPNVKIIHSPKNINLNAYHKLFSLARGEIIMEIDDDVIEFPENFDRRTLECMNAFPDYAYFALNVIQNEHTNGARPDASAYTSETRCGLTMLNGPVGGWCTAFRARDFRLFDFLFYRFPLSFKSVRTIEDGLLSFFFAEVLGRKNGIMKDLYCLHATGAHYARLFNNTARQREKYLKAGNRELAESYNAVLS